MDFSTTIAAMLLAGLAALAAAVAAVLAVAFALRRRWREQEARRSRGFEDWARRHGWSYRRTDDSLRVSFEVRGRLPSGTEWILTFDPQFGAKNAQPEFAWHAPGLAARGPELWGTSPDVLLASRGTVGSVAKAVGRWFPNNKLTRMTQLLTLDQTLEPRSQELRPHLVFACRSPSRCAQLVDAGVEDLLRSFPASEPPVVPGRTLHLIHDAQGLSVTVRNDAAETPVAEHVVRIGEALAERCSRMSL